MSGGVVQLVAVGAQDAWLTGKPEVSFYRSNYKRYTHYANSVERQVIQGQPIAGGISTIRFEKKGDLLSYVYLTVRDGNGAQLVNPDWTRIIDKVELLIGGQIVDTQDIEYMTDIEPITGAQNYSQRYLNNNSATFNNQKNSFLPLKFFFCKDWSVCLPLIGLQFHDVEVRITWSPYLSQNVTIGNTTTPVLPSQPQATANILSDTVLSSNLANVILTQTTGPLFPGMLVVGQTANLQTNVAVVQSFSNAFAPVSGQGYFSNVVISFSNASASFMAGAFLTGNVASLYVPTCSAQINTSTAITVSSGLTSLSLPLDQIVSPLGQGGVQLGQYVAGLPITGPVYVSSTSNLASSNVTVSFPATTSPTTIPSYLTVAFVTGTAQTSTSYASLQYQAWTNFVYLDQTERDYFAKAPVYDMLITQVQRVVLGTNPVQELALAQPVKFLAFPCVNYAQIYANGVGSATALNYQLKTQVNGVDVGDSRSLIHFSDVPQYYNTPFGYVHNNSVANVAIISYCLDTSKLQPTGTLNFSRLDTFRIVVPPTLPNGVLGLYNTNITSAYPTPYLYAVNYNIFRIQNGLGSILYAN
jgi:Major capsid protein N-terminus/Large eukaryotic DNA virus major capsid protein